MWLGWEALPSWGSSTRSLPGADGLRRRSLRQHGLPPRRHRRDPRAARQHDRARGGRNGTRCDGCYRPQLAEWYAGGRRSRQAADYAAPRRRQRAHPTSPSRVRRGKRGTNENTNDLLRQYLPKGHSIAHLTQHDRNRIATKLNRRPRKRLGYRTLEECYALCLP